MGNVLNFWNGHKTNILALAGALVSFAFAMAWIDLKLYLALGGLLGFSATATQRHAVAQVAAVLTTKVDQVAATGRHVAAQVADVKATVAELPGAPVLPPLPPLAGRLRRPE